MQIIPAIDLRGGRCVRLTKGRQDATKVYDADPVEVARGFAADGAQLIHVVDLDAAFAKNETGDAPNLRTIERIVREADVPVEFGGGLRSVEAVKRMIDLGVRQVIIGTLAVRAPDVLAELVNQFGARIIVGIDAQNGFVMTHGWEQGSELSAVDLARRIANQGVQRIIYTDTDRDGTFEGVNVAQSVRVAVESGLHITASGGTGTLDHLAALARTAHESAANIDSVIVGKALYEGRFTLTEAMRAVEVV